jgi:two-component system phosphate regulon response regulator PhoB
LKKILIIEDDITIVRGLEAAFRFHGFDLLTAGEGAAGLTLLQSKKPDLIILDIMLPGLDGFATCKKIREFNENIPIIILSAKTRESDKLLGFELGADDYVTKPFSTKELIARIQANLKRLEKNNPDMNEVNVGNITINFNNFTLTKEGEECSLSPKEHDILKLFIEKPEQVISRDRIIDIVWGDDYFPTPKTVDNFIRKLRAKIENDPKKPRHILTVHGAGYKFKP